MQQPGPMYPVMPSFPPTSITTEQIQKYLDENKKLILAILDNQNLGKLAECAQYQAQLQKNLMYLAAIADAQPQTAAIPPQMSPHPAMQQGGFYMQQHPPQMVQQFPSRPVFSNPHSMQDMQHHLQATQSLRPVGSTQLKDANSKAGNKQQDKPDGGAVATSDGQGQGQGNSNAVEMERNQNEEGLHKNV